MKTTDKVKIRVMPNFEKLQPLIFTEANLYITALIIILQNIMAWVVFHVDNNDRSVAKQASHYDVGPFWF